MLKQILIAADTGIDDSIAILFALKRPDVRVMGVTTGFGNTTARQAAENITSVGVRKMNASTFISSNVEHNSSNSVCEQSASCTMLTDMNRPCCLAIASSEEIAEIGP